MISPMFVNMRHPHVILAMRKDTPAAQPTSGWGSVRGGVPVLRYGKSLGGYTVMNVRSEIDNSDNETETGTWCTVHPPRTGSERHHPGNGRDRAARGGKQTWDKHVSYSCYYRARATYCCVFCVENTTMEFIGTRGLAGKITMRSPDALFQKCREYQKEQNMKVPH